MEKGGWIGIIIILIVIIIVLYTGGAPRRGCENDDDCASEVRLHCDQNYACQMNLDHKCVEGTCILYNCSTGCDFCPYNCENGECIGPINKSDLVILQVFNETNISTQIVSIYPKISNIGTKTAPNSTTRISLASGEVFDLYTKSLDVGESDIIGPLNYSQPMASIQTVTVTVDAKNEIDEENEGNNQVYFEVAMG